MEKSCGTIIFNDNKVLVVKQLSGFYGFPKGHIDGDETEVETAIRETKEEVGIDVIVDSNLRFSMSFLVRESILKEVVYFVAYPKSNDSISIQEDEIASAMWINIDEVYDVLTFNNLKELWSSVLKKYNKVNDSKIDI